MFILAGNEDIHDSSEEFKDLFAVARGGVHTCTSKGQCDNRGAAQNHSKPGIKQAENRRLSVVKDI